MGKAAVDRFYILSGHAPRATSFNCRHTGHIRPETTCNLAVKLFINILLVITNTFASFTPKDLKKKIVISSAS